MSLRGADCARMLIRATSEFLLHGCTGGCLVSAAVAATPQLVAETLALGIAVVLMVAAIAVGTAAPVLFFVRSHVQRTATLNFATAGRVRQRRAKPMPKEPCSRWQGRSRLVGLGLHAPRDDGTVRDV